MILHEPTDTPNWDTKIVCSCGERCSNWMEFWRHRGDEYKAQISLPVVAVEDERRACESNRGDA